MSTQAPLPPAEERRLSALYAYELLATPPEDAFCAHAILDEGIMEVDDAAADPRFAEDPLVAGEPGIGFYAGVPLRTPEGFALGTLCIMDTSPRVLTGAQRSALS